jgi:hypothetical protein
MGVGLKPTILKAKKELLTPEQAIILILEQQKTDRQNLMVKGTIRKAVGPPM